MGNPSGPKLSSMNTGAPYSGQARGFQLLLIVSTLALSWLGMMAVHEFGHVLLAWLSGGMVATVVVGPLEFSRTELQINPHPLAVAWGGALVGLSPATPESTWLSAFGRCGSGDA